MTIIIVLKNEEKIYIHSTASEETLEELKKNISSILNNNSNHIHFNHISFDINVMVMKDQIRSIYFYS